MPVLNRTIFGALIGALLVLLFHGYTRPYFAPWVTTSGREVLRQTPMLPENVQRAPTPDSAERAAYWMLLACEQMQAESNLSRTILNHWSQVATAWAERDRENAFWHQMLAVIREALGDHAGSDEAWRRASRQPRWNDFQTERLVNLVGSLHPGSRRGPSWESAWICSQRSPVVADVIFRYARKRLSTVDPRSTLGLTERALTLRNGVLLRDGSRSVESFRIGMAMVELSSRDRVVTTESSQRKLLLQRFEFINGLRAAGRGGDADFAATEFRKNSSWDPVVDPNEKQALTGRIALLGLAGIVLPSAFVVGVLLFLALYLVGSVMKRFPATNTLFSARWAPWIGLVIGILVFALTQLLWTSLLVVVGMSLFGFVPTSRRQQEPDDLGPLFRLMVMLAGTAILIVWVWLWASQTTGGSLLVRDLVLPADLAQQSSVLTGVMAVLLFLTMLLAPVWSVVQRYPAPRIVPIVFRELGGRMAMVCLVLAVLLGPVAIWIDQENRITAEALAQNEPIYFYNQWNR